MLLKNFVYILVLSVLFSCTTTQKETPSVQKEKPLMSVPKKYPSPKEIRPIYKKDIENWSQLNALNDFLKRFKNVSTKEALSNAEELEGLVATLKKEEKPVLFTIAPFQARLNILHNEALRLSDMRNIPSITVAEVAEQIKKIVQSFSAVHSKINTILSKKRFEEAIEVNEAAIGLDTSKVNFVSNYSKTNNLQRKLEEKAKDL